MIPPRSLDRRAFLRQTLGGSLLVPALAPGATPLAKLLGGAAPGLHHAAKAKRRKVWGLRHVAAVALERCL